MTDLEDDRRRRRICEACEVIVICGEHTGDSMRVSAELRIAQEENKPHFHLLGSRESMCTEPVGSKRDGGMYSWTWEILQNQIVTTLRQAQPLEIPEHCKRRPAATRDSERLNELWRRISRTTVERRRRSGTPPKRVKAEVR